MIPVWITDAAAVTSLGNDLQSLWKSLLEGKTGIKQVRRFSAECYRAEIAACVKGLEPSGDRSMVHALIDRLLMSMGPVPRDCLLFTATAKAGIDNLERMSRGIPADRRDILPLRVGQIVSKRLGLIGEGINISAACASSTVALAQGASLIASGRANAVLVCCLDLLTEYVFSGFSALQAMSPDPCRPFDRDRRGMTLGEGAAALLLMSGQRARKDGREHLGTISGWSITNDASHITAPAADACGLIQAVRLAKRKARLPREKIAAVCAHGTGTVHNDVMELTAFRETLGGREVPIFSVKGAVGHTIGASGGIETAICLKSLADRIAPPTVGFRNPEKGAEGLVSPSPAAIKGDFILKTSSGFGGVNAAIVLGKGALP